VRLRSLGVRGVTFGRNGQIIDQPVTAPRCDRQYGGDVVLGVARLRSDLVKQHKEGRLRRRIGVPVEQCAVGRQRADLVERL
jgi:hypothetical protein